MSKEGERFGNGATPGDVLVKERSRKEALFSLGPEFVNIPEAEISVGYGAWGRPFGNEDLLNLVIIDEAGREDVLKMIDGTGIVRRFHDYPPLIRERSDPLFVEEFFTQEEIDRQTRIGARLTREALEANGWESADLLVVTGSFAPVEKFADRVAEEAGLHNAATKDYRLACNGAIAAWQDILRNDEWKKARVVITAVEGLSVGVDFFDPTTAAIFGNGGSSLAFSPQKIEFLGGKIVIHPDKEAVIRIPKTYDLPPIDQRRTPPDYYELREGAGEVFAYAENSVVMMMAQPSDPDKPYYTQMNGVETARFFKYLVSPVVVSVLKDYHQRYGDPVKTSVFHQPSKVVIRHANREIGKLLKREGLSDEVEIEWVLDKVGMSNVSSATTFLHLAQSIKEGKIRRGEPILVTGFGIGASATSMVIRI